MPNAALPFLFQNTFQPFGVAKPEVLQAARVIMNHGWRVTSIVRPDTPTLRGPNHAKGIALDIAPLVGGRGGFGPETGLVVAKLLRRELPHAWFDVVGEKDHYHIQLKPVQEARVGVLLSPGHVQWVYVVQ